MKWLQYDLPGVFLANPYPDVINGALWSLFYEVACYCIVVVAGSIGLTARHWSFLGGLIVYVTGYLIVKLSHLHGNTLLGNFSQLTLPFVIGMGFYQFRRFLPLNLLSCIIAAGGAFLSYGSPWFQEFFVVFWSYSIFYLGKLSFKPIRRYNALGDYSYGMYIYAFPCQQIAVAFWKGITPAGLMAVAFPMTLACAVLSWHLLEKRVLAQRSAVVGWLHRLLPRHAAAGRG